MKAHVVIAKTTYYEVLVEVTTDESSSSVLGQFESFTDEQKESHRAVDYDGALVTDKWEVLPRCVYLPDEEAAADIVGWPVYNWNV